MTPATPTNCTEWLQHGNTAALQSFCSHVDHVVRSASETDNTHQTPHKQQEVCVPINRKEVFKRSLKLHPFDAACVATWKVPHRRSSTEGAVASRITLNIDFTTASEAQLRKLRFVDDDMNTSASTLGVVGECLPLF